MNDTPEVSYTALHNEHWQKRYNIICIMKHWWFVFQYNWSNWKKSNECSLFEAKNWWSVWCSTLSKYNYWRKSSFFLNKLLSLSNLMNSLISYILRSTPCDEDATKRFAQETENRNVAKFFLGSKSRLVLVNKNNYISPRNMVTDKSWYIFNFLLSWFVIFTQVFTIVKVYYFLFDFNCQTKLQKNNREYLEDYCNDNFSFSW